MFCRWLAAAKYKFESFNFFKFLPPFHLLQCFDARLYQICQTCLGPKARDKLLRFFATPLIFYPCFFINFLVLCNLMVVFAGISSDFANLAAMNPHGVGNDFIHEASVVGNEHEFVGPGVEKSHNPSDRGNIEIIGRFV